MSYIKLSLGTVYITKSTWETLRTKYSRDDIRQIIVQNGEETLLDVLTQLEQDIEQMPISVRAHSLDVQDNWRKNSKK